MAGAAPSPLAARFHRRLIAGAAALFGMGALFTNAVALLAPPEARDPGVPVPLLAFDAAMALLYLAAAWGVGWERTWAVTLVWAVAVLHAFSASGAAVAYVASLGVSGAALTGELVREGFWVLVGIYVRRGR